MRAMVSLEAETSPAQALHVLAIIEGSTVSGPLKNLLTSFACLRRCADGFPAVVGSIATYVRRSSPATAAAQNVLVEESIRAGLAVDVMQERFRYDPGMLPALRSLVRRHHPGVLQTHNVKSHFLVRLAGLYRCQPWIAFQHGYTAKDLRDRAYNHLDRWSLRAADLVVTMNRPFADALVRSGVRPDRIRILHNAIDPGRVAGASEEAVADARAALRLGPAERVVLAVGRLSAEKGHADLVRAFASVAPALVDPGARLVLVGDGPEMARLERLARASAARDHVCFVGHASDVRPWYAVADVFVLPSHSEGSPNVLLEAMAAGLPIIATSVGGVPEMVEKDREALLVPPRDPQALAQALAGLLREPERARTLGELARSAALRFTPEARAERVRALYAEALARRAKQGCETAR